MSTVLLWCKLKDTCVCTVRLFHYEITRYLAIWPGRQFNLISILDCALRTWNKSINHFRPCFYRYIRKLRRSSLKFPLSSEIHLLWFGTFEHYSDVKRVSFIKHFDVFPSPLCDFSGSFYCREGVKWQDSQAEAEFGGHLIHPHQMRTLRRTNYETDPNSSVGQQHIEVQSPRSFWTQPSSFFTPFWGSLSSLLQRLYRVIS